MRGDVLFFKGGGGIADRLISWRTKGPFTHVEVDLGDGTAIGAVRRGVTRHPIILPNPRITSFSPQTTRERIEAGIVFLQEAVGSHYSWGDILNQVLTLLPFAPVVLVERHAFDCSDLVGHYLEIAGGVDVDVLEQTPQLVTPNDLARAAGLF